MNWLHVPHLRLAEEESQPASCSLNTQMQGDTQAEALARPKTELPLILLLLSLHLPVSATRGLSESNMGPAEPGEAPRFPRKASHPTLLAHRFQISRVREGRQSLRSTTVTLISISHQTTSTATSYLTPSAKILAQVLSTDRRQNPGGETEQNACC